jgi:hypothetical protein
MRDYANCNCESCRSMRNPKQSVITSLTKSMDTLIKRLLDPDSQLLVEFGVIDNDGDLDLTNGITAQAVFNVIKTEAIALAKAEKAKQEKNKK